jgi:hypothetical protein
MVLYSDATGHGHMAWVADLGEYKVYSEIVAPCWLRRWVQPRKVQVATWELIAALCALWSLLSKLKSQGPQWEILLFVDSSVALGTLLKGCSRQRDWNSLVADLWFHTSSIGAFLTAWRVPSRQNLADAPTRPTKKTHELKILHEQGFTKTPWEWPHVWLRLDNRDDK